MFRLKFVPIFFALAFLALITSCEDVIKLDLKQAATRTVIDATFNVSEGECHAHLSRTLGFYESDSSDWIEGATITLIHPDGSINNLVEMRPGFYSKTGIRTFPGDTLTLRVSVSGNEVFIAKTTVPVPVTLESLKVMPSIGDPRPGGRKVFTLHSKWQDPAGVDNFYRFKGSVNGRQRDGFNIVNDRQLDGTVIEMPLFRFRVEPGDTVHLEFQSIDSVSYSYFNQINDMARPSFVAATPYNPIGNFDNGALGYFGVYSSDVRDLIVTLGR